MFTKKEIIQYQKIKAYLKFYYFLINKDIENFNQYVTSQRKVYLNKSNAAEKMLIKIAEGALNDKEI